MKTGGKGSYWCWSIRLAFLRRSDSCTTVVNHDGLSWSWRRCQEVRASRLSRIDSQRLTEWSGRNFFDGMSWSWMLGRQLMIERIGEWSWWWLACRWENRQDQPSGSCRRIILRDHVSKKSFNYLGSKIWSSWLLIIFYIGFIRAN